MQIVAKAMFYPGIFSYLIEDEPGYKLCFFKDTGNVSGTSNLTLAHPWLYYGVWIHGAMDIDEYRAFHPEQRKTTHLSAKNYPWQLEIKVDTLFASREQLDLKKPQFITVPFPNCGNHGYTCSLPALYNVANWKKDRDLLALFHAGRFFDERFAYQESYSDSAQALYRLVGIDLYKQMMTHTRYMSLEPFRYWQDNYTPENITEVPFFEEHSIKDANGGGANILEQIGLKNTKNIIYAKGVVQ